MNEDATRWLAFANEDLRTRSGSIEQPHSL